jgi:hypothetical protein
MTRRSGAAGRGRSLTIGQWIDRLLRPSAPIVRKARSTLPGYVNLDDLGAELWGRGHMLIITKTQIVVLKSAHMVIAP